MRDPDWCGVCGYLAAQWLCHTLKRASLYAPDHVDGLVSRCGLHLMDEVYSLDKGWRILTREEAAVHWVLGS